MAHLPTLPANSQGAAHGLPFLQAAGLSKPAHGSAAHKAKLARDVGDAIGHPVHVRGEGDD